MKYYFKVVKGVTSKARITIDISTIFFHYILLCQYFHVVLCCYRRHTHSMGAKMTKKSVSYINRNKT